MNNDITRPTAARGGRGSYCFPADAMVSTRRHGDGLDAAPEVRPIASLEIGDLVLTSQGYSAVYLHGHQDPDAMTMMRRLETSDGRSIELSMGHYIEASGRHTIAKKVAPGMRVVVRRADGTLEPRQVTEASDVLKRGLYNPMTLAGDIVIVKDGAEGVVASDQSDWFAEHLVPEHMVPATHHAVLAPVRLIFAAAPEWVRRFDALTRRLLASERDPIAGGAHIKSLDQLGVMAIARAALMTSPLLHKARAGRAQDEL